MNSVEITPQAKSLFEKKMFGQLVIEYKENEFRWINKHDNYDSGYLPYQVLEVNANSIIIKQKMDLLGEFVTNIYPEGNCYYIIVSKFRFKEYYCRLNNDF